MGDFILVTGGARSGKSRFAELLAACSGLPVTYIATAQIWDQEMAERVEIHRQRRPAEWNVIEEPYDIEKILLSLKEKPGFILLDCVTVWLSNLLLAASDSEITQQELKGSTAAGSCPSDSLKPAAEDKILTQVCQVAQTAAEIQPRVVFVTNEVGQGIVPDNPLARKYRDLAGRANQILAEAADSVYVVMAGYPLEIKRPGQQILNNLLSQN
ncbi:MAG TPA: bifunctional adenosylcobinamide kinase/adenosylcobinamide-phosphate guanylyltransferase [Desulfitobacteriaceae bacterium]|nr:bifunctional adenosylcobinamide kinase/adenosylcobinamide-phosphate guanylyltransferase [Desulfitobacteriaceae bacterium]